MNQQPFFSVIIPVYNVDQYIKQCVDSVLAQSFTSYNIILIDDGSPDMSGVILDQYAKSYSHVMVIHQANEGLSSARNAGLAAATGEYIIFLDSDDFWDDIDVLKSIHELLMESKADVVITLAKRYYDQTGKSKNVIKMNCERSDIISLDINDALDYMIQHNILKAMAPKFIVTKKLIELHHLRFLHGFLNEDIDWCGKILLYAESLDIYCRPFYYYRQRQGSISKVPTVKLLADRITLCEEGYSRIQRMNDIRRKRVLGSFFAYEYAVLLGLHSDKKDKMLEKRIYENREILKYDTSNKVKMVRALYRLIGWRMTRNMLCLFVRLKDMNFRTPRKRGT